MEIFKIYLKEASYLYGDGEYKSFLLFSLTDFFLYLRQRFCRCQQWPTQTQIGMSSNATTGGIQIIQQNLFGTSHSWSQKKALKEPDAKLLN